MPHLGGHRGHMNVITGDIFKQCHQIDFLLVIAAHGRARLLPNDCYHALVIHFGVIKAIEQMDSTRPASG